MGRTNLVILLFGLAACVAMSLMMQRLLKLSEKDRASPVTREVSDLFATRLDGQVRYEIVDEDGGARIGRIHARLAAGLTRQDRLAQMIGQHVWRRDGARRSLTAVEVITVDAVDGRSRRHDVRPPLDVRRRQGAAEPRPVSAPAATRARGAPPREAAGAPPAAPPPATSQPEVPQPDTPPPGSEAATPPAPGGKR